MILLLAVSCIEILMSIVAMAAFKRQFGYSAMEKLREE